MKIIRSSYTDRRRYSLNLDNLTGEELLSVEQTLSDIIDIYDEEESDIGEKIENYHQEKMDRYRSTHQIHPRQFGGKRYDDDPSWMYAERATIQMLMNRIEDDWIDYYYDSGNIGSIPDEDRSAWDKALKKLPSGRW